MIQRKISGKFEQKLKIIAGQGFRNAAQGFSQMIGRELSVNNPGVKTVSLKEIPDILGGPENDAVGIYLRVEGEMKGQVMLVIPYQQALELADMLLGEETGHTQKLGSMERSALAEVGNLTGSFFLNAIAEITGVTSRPSPPAVMVDMVGSILDVIIATMGEVGEEVLMFQATFMCGDREVRADFWVVPDAITLKKLTDDGT